MENNKLQLCLRRSKNVFRTFEPEILKTFKNIQPKPKIRRSHNNKPEQQQTFICISFSNIDLHY